MIGVDRETEGRPGVPHVCLGLKLAVDDLIGLFDWLSAIDVSGSTNHKGSLVRERDNLEHESLNKDALILLVVEGQVCVWDASSDSARGFLYKLAEGSLIYLKVRWLCWGGRLADLWLSCNWVAHLWLLNGLLLSGKRLVLDHVSDSWDLGIDSLLALLHVSVNLWH